MLGSGYTIKQKVVLALELLKIKFEVNFSICHCIPYDLNWEVYSYSVKNNENLIVSIHLKIQIHKIHIVYLFYV